MLKASDAGQHALLVADTGAGKTLAGFLPTLAAFCDDRLNGAAPPAGLHTLYVSPLKALAHDVQRNLVTPVEEMGLPIRVETRSGDTPSDRKRRQRDKPPHVLLTTPESLSLLLSYPEAATMFAGLKLAQDHQQSSTTAHLSRVFVDCHALRRMRPRKRRRRRPPAHQYHGPLVEGICKTAVHRDV